MDTIGKIYTVSFFGHRNIDNILLVENKLKTLIKNIINENPFVEFLVGRNGDFDEIVASCITNVKRTYRSDNCATARKSSVRLREWSNERISRRTFRQKDQGAREWPRAF